MQYLRKNLFNDGAMAAGMAWNRRTFLKSAGLPLGAVALSALGGLGAGTSQATGAGRSSPPQQPAAKRIIYLFQSGAPSQIDLFDYKPQVEKLFGEELPESIRMGQRLTTMTSGQASFPLAPSIFKFKQHGANGSWFSELVPHMAELSDDWCIVRSMVTEAINHDPAITFFQTGSQLAGRPSFGAWVAYGLGSLNNDLPSFVVMLSRARTGQPLYDRLWGSGFLPSEHQGVKLRSGADPVLYLSNPTGCSTASRRRVLDDLAKLNRLQYEQTGDDETLARISQYELAFRMQTSVPDLTDISDEPKHMLDMYGPDVHTPGTYARNCLLARRMAERDVRFIQLYHMDWDQHNNLPSDLRLMCKSADQPSAALVQDLKQRGLLDDTLVVWGGRVRSDNLLTGRTD